MGDGSQLRPRDLVAYKEDIICLEHQSLNCNEGHGEDSRGKINAYVVYASLCKERVERLLWNGIFVARLSRI